VFRRALSRVERLVVNYVIIDNYLLFSMCKLKAVR
jgi:hypothetical protein